MAMYMISMFSISRVFISNMELSVSGTGEMTPRIRSTICYKLALLVCNYLKITDKQVARLGGMKCQGR